MIRLYEKELNHTPHIYDNKNYDNNHLDDNLHGGVNPDTENTDDQRKETEKNQKIISKEVQGRKV